MCLKRGDWQAGRSSSTLGRPLTQQLRGVRASERTKLGDQVSLVEVAGAMGQRAPVRSWVCPGEGERALEPDHAQETLWRHADHAREGATQVTQGDNLLRNGERYDNEY
jgi:hypothetical protein